MGFEFDFGTSEKDESLAVEQVVIPPKQVQVIFEEGQPVMATRIEFGLWKRLVSDIKIELAHKDSLDGTDLLVDALHQNTDIIKGNFHCLILGIFWSILIVRYQNRIFFF